MNKKLNVIFGFLNNYFSFFIIAFLWIWSVLKLDGKKFDTGFRIDLMLAVGILVPLLVLFIWNKKRQNLFVEHLVLIGFFFLSLLSFVFSEVKTFGFSEIVLCGAMVVLYIYLSSTDIKWKNLFLKLVVILAFVSVFQGFVQYFTRPELRMAGFFYDKNVIAHLWPNAFALFLLMIWPVFVWLPIGKFKFLKSVLLGFLLSGLILTYSRAAFIAFLGQIVLLALYFVFFKKEKSKKTIFKLAIVFLSTILFIIGANQVRSQIFPVQSFQEKATFTAQEKTSSINERLEMMKAGLKMSVDKPLFGYGPYSFRYVYPEYQNEFLAHSDHPHNWLVKLAAERGLPAALLLLSFFLITAFSIIKNIKHLDIKQRDFIVFLSISILGALAHSLVDFNFNFVSTLMLFWVLLGFVRGEIIPKNMRSRVPTNTINVCITIIAIIIFIVSIREGYYSFKIARTGADYYFKEDYDKSYVYFEKYAQAFFPRNYFMELGWWSFSRNQIDLAEKFLQVEVSKNPHDAESWKLLGELAEKKGDFNTALKFHEISLKEDPMNNFVYYYNVFKLLDYKEIRNRQDRVLNLLENYENQVRNNVHFTAVRGDNVRFAVKMYELLSRANSDKRAEFTKKAETLQSLAKTHKENFESILEYWRERGYSI